MIGATVFGSVVLALAVSFPDAAPPLIGLLVVGCSFSLSLGAFGEPRRFVPWRHVDPAGVWFFHFIAVIGSAMAIYVAWALHACIP